MCTCVVPMEASRGLWVYLELELHGCEPATLCGHWKLNMVLWKSSKFSHLLSQSLFWLVKDTALLLLLFNYIISVQS